MPEFDNLREPREPTRPHGDKLAEALPDGDEPEMEDEGEERTGLLADTAADRLDAASSDAPEME